MFHVEHFFLKCFSMSYSVEIKEKLEIYENLLRKWQKAINLISNETLEDFWKRHIEDSLQLVPYIRGTKILDIGSGGGFPGMVLAIVGQDVDFCANLGINEADLPLQVTCVDSDHRKMLFLSEVSRLTDTKVNLITDRIENVDGQFDTVTARGFSNLTSLIDLTQKYSKYGIFLKGESLGKEILEAQKKFRFNFDIFQSKTSESGKIISVYDIENEQNL